MLTRILTAVCSAGLCVQAALAAPVDFRPRFTAGSSEAKVTVRLDQRATMPSPMGDLNSDTNQMVVLRERVKSAEAGKGAEVELTYVRVQFKGRTQAGPVDFDSASDRGEQPPDPMNFNMDGTPMVAKHLRGLIGKTITVKFDAEGKITSVDGQGDEGVPMMMGPICGLKADAKSLSLLFGPSGSMPADKAKGAEVGESWDYSESTVIEPMGKHTIRMKQALRSSGASQVTLEFSGKFEEAEDSSRTVSYMKVVDSSIGGGFVWDFKASRMISGRTDVRTKVATSDGAGGSMTANNRAVMSVERELK